MLGMTEYEGCPPSQFAQWDVLVQSSAGRSLSSHFTQVSHPRQLRDPWPYLWHLKHLQGFGMYGLTHTSVYTVSRCLGSLLEPNVKIRSFIGISLSSRHIFIPCTSITLCCFHPSSSSTLLRSMKSSTLPHGQCSWTYALWLMGMSPNFSRLTNLSCWLLLQIEKQISTCHFRCIVASAKLFCKAFEHKEWGNGLSWFVSLFPV